jgi:hypothetical protein
MDDPVSSISAVSVVFTETLASMTKRSYRVFVDLDLAPETGT